MSYQLGPVSTPDDYTGAALLQLAVECARIDMWVSNNPVRYRLYRDAGGALAQNDIYLPSAAGQTFFLSIDRLTYGIEFKSAIPGSPGVVVCELITADELPDTS